MDRNKFMNFFSNSFPQETCLMTSEIPVGNKNIVFVYVNLYLDGKEFYLRFTFDKSNTDCEVVIEENREHDLNLLIAHYTIESAVIEPIDISVLNNTVADIIKRINDAYKNS